MLEQRVRIINQLGLHARAAAKLVKLSAGFSSVIVLSFGDATANARSILDILGLGAGCGKNIDISVDGPDETEAMKSVAALFRDGFGEH